MTTYPIDFQLTDIQGIISVAAYIHYIIPGSIRLQSIVIIPFTNQKEQFFASTRRWLQKGEAPYPGYCRAPGSAQCRPILCNCDKLKEIWENIKNTEKRLKENKHF